MIPWLTENFGNPASRSHAFGWASEAAVEEARGNVAQLVNCDSKELVWTSGATESINLAVRGVALASQHRGRHIITTQIEHRAVLDTTRQLEKQGLAAAAALRQALAADPVPEVRRRLKDLLEKLEPSQSPALLRVLRAGHRISAPLRTGTGRGLAGRRNSPGHHPMPIQ